ncbi:DUF2130 domain-containing protein [Altererythrobacter sp. RZ02]|uniref:DUF2130 domain-containing protein n=2 Tax=Pontixanthobacter rizhaonensis TaxID=2730337 RepID=A0A848QJG6_9SPHN|nr:DUF2130 domain-containing protein [Pontixanthobacter rizhaonensis]
MEEPIIECPNCGTNIKLTESLAGPLVAATRSEFEAKLDAQKQKFEARELAIKSKEVELAEAETALDENVKELVKAERAKITDEEKRKAQLIANAEIEEKSKEVVELKELIKQRTEKLAEAQAVQAELLKKERLLDDAKRELDLTIEKRVQESIVAVRTAAKAEVEGELKLKVSEKEEQILSMQRQIEELRRKSEQGSQQLQGEVLELELEEALTARFPVDDIEPVPKGEFGGDVIQKVRSPSGAFVGTILWESKRTRNWSDGWLAKLRNDQRTANAEISIIMSTALPKDIENFGQVDGVWVSAPAFGLGLVAALRQTLIEVAMTKSARQGQDTKMELIYDYLTGPRFRHRVEAIVEKFSDMKADLDREKKAMTRLWAKREIQIQSVIESTVGMYGDFQGIAGQALQEIEGLELPMIEYDEKSSE